MCYVMRCVENKEWPSSTGSLVGEIRLYRNDCNPDSATQVKYALSMSSTPGSRNRKGNISFTALIIWGKCQGGVGHVGQWWFLPQTTSW